MTATDTKGTTADGPGRPPGPTLSRRSFALGSLSLLAAAGLAACGSGDKTAAGGDTSRPASTGDAGSGTASSGATGSVTHSVSSPPPAVDTFPMTIEHKLGSTTIPAEPKNIVSVGLTEQDFLLALGIVPVADTDWYGGQPNAIWPWAKKALGTAAPPTMLTDADGIQYLEIAKLKPDLILGLNAGLDQKAYQQAAKIAPTIASPAGGTTDYFDAWPLYLEVIGRAVGRSAQAAQIEADLHKRFADAAAANPHFAGKKAIFIQGAVSDGNFYAYEKGLGTEFLTDLGFDIPAELDEYVPAEGGQALVPAERIDVFNSADYLIWATESDADEAALKALPGFADLTAVKADRSVYTGDILSGAIYFSSVLSLPYVLDHLVPLLNA
jgi:iron complex transport system substrate-binding protein